MSRRRGPVQAQGNRLHAGILKRGHALKGQQRSGRRRKGHANSTFPGGRHDLFEIVTAQRIASGEDDVGQRIAEIQHVIEDPLALIRGEFAGKGAPHGLGAAVTAHQIARQSELPIDDHGSPIVGEIQWANRTNRLRIISVHGRTLSFQHVLLMLIVVLTAGRT